jgi:RNA ligase (TIGR02306 family)
MRKLASIQRIWKIESIPDADKIELIHVLGWQCVAQKGQFKENELCVYFEIDSFLPVRPEYEFLRASSYRSNELMGEGFKIRTVKLRGQISQGLIIPVPDNMKDLPEGTDVTEQLNVKEWTVPEKESSAGIIIGNRPPFIPKTNETRCFVGSTKIITQDGLKYIRDIVNHKIQCNVLTYNERNDNIEWSPITNYYKFKSTEPMCDITIPFKYGENKTNHLKGTLDHKIMTKAG